MENFITSIYIKPNHANDERICVGLFVGGAKKSFFSWSLNKLKILTKISDNDVVDSLSKTFSNIEKDIKKETKKDSELKIFSNDKYSSNYFNYSKNNS